MTNYRDPQFLKEHIQSILDFYQPNILDKDGGFFQNFYDDGTVFNPGLRHLVSSTRMVFNYCKAHELFGEKHYLDYAEHGIKFIREHHWDETRQGYNWTLQDKKLLEQTNHCYGLAFVILAFATAYKAGFSDAKADLERAYDIMEKQLWQADTGLYADEATADWKTVSPYRGQNANMHACEAMLIAYEATQDKKYLNRAYQLAQKFSIDMADKGDGFIWEHYKKDLSIDWDYNKGDPKNLYRPWGFQPGHQTEWAKLLLILHSHKPEDWMLERAQSFFDRSLEICWDKKQSGILYGFAPDQTICDDDKYFWVQAESFAAAARLATASKGKKQQEKYWAWYDKIWQYADTHMVDHQHGAWYRVLDADNKKYSNEKSTAGGKCDYHTLGACYDVLTYSLK